MDILCFIHNRIFKYTHTIPKHMSITKEFLMAQNTIAPTGTSAEPTSVKDRNIDHLIAQLTHQNITIAPKHSQKDICYTFNGEVAGATVPLVSTFERDIMIVGYTLRTGYHDQQLEIRLTNHYENDMKGNGIHCTLNMKFGRESRPEDTKLVDDAKQVVQAFYDCKTPSLPGIL